MTDAAPRPHHFVDIRPGRPDHRHVQSLARILLTAGLVVAVLGGASARAATADSPPADRTAPAPTVSVVSIGPATLPAEFASRLASAAAAGLTAAGAEVVPAAAAPTAPDACVGPACGPAPVVSAAARFLLSGTCVVEGSTYRLHLELIDTRTNTVAVGRDDLCEICTETEVADATNIAASALKVALDRSLRPLVQAPPAASLKGPGEGGASGAPATPAWRRALPWVAFGASAAALGAGVYTWSRNGGQTTDSTYGTSPNNRIYDTVWVNALPLLGVGVAAAVVGVLTLPHARPPAHTDEPSSPPAPGVPTSAPGPTGTPPRTQGLLVGPRGVTAWATF